MELEQDAKEIIRRIKERHGKRIATRRSIALDQEMATDARRFVQACREYAQPGSDVNNLEGGALGDLGLLFERVAANPNWREVNEAFCRQWLGVWVQSVPSVLHHLGLANVQAMEVTSSAKFTRDLYLRMLKGKDPVREVEDLVPALMALRVELDEARFELGDFFEVLDECVRQRSKDLRARNEGGAVDLNFGSATETGAGAGPAEGAKACDADVSIFYYRFMKRGKVWDIAFEDEIGTLPNRVALERVQMLLRREGQEVPVEEILGLPAPLSRGDKVNDDMAIKTYKAKMGRLLTQQEACDDPAELADLKEQLEILERQTTKNHRLGGASRQLGDDAKAAASRVGKSIDRLCSHIAETGMPKLAAHLRDSIIGYSSMCPVYRPKSRVPWTFLC